MALQALLSEVDYALKVLQATRLSDMACVTMIAYDYLLTFDREWTLVWKNTKDWSIPKLLFIFLRYFAIFVATLDTTSKIWFHWQYCSGILLFAASEGILCFRIYAMYYRSKRIRIFLLVCFFTTLVIALGIYPLIGAPDEGTIAVVPGLYYRFCYPSFLPSNLYAYWLPFLGFETILLSLALYRGYTSLKMQRSYENHFPQLGKVINILVKDSILYFLVVFTAYSVSLILWLVRPIDQGEIPITFTIPTTVIMSQRLYLKVKGGFYKDEERSTFSTSESSSLGPQNFIELSTLGKRNEPKTPF